MRISGGAARGILLKVPAGDAVRPATDSLRQAVFSSLGERVVNARFLDLFAGSGSYGLEALSRGAWGGTFVEKAPTTVTCLKANIEAVKKSILQSIPRDFPLRIVENDVLAADFPEPAPDLVFIDPPYEIIGEVAEIIFSRMTQLAAPDAIVIFELPGQLELKPAGWQGFKRLGKGGRQPTAGFFRRT
jgi:16S rRNA (guanine966-N2)-methyltransferase